MNATRAWIGVAATLVLAGCASPPKEMPEPRGGTALPRVSFESLDTDKSAGVDREEFEKFAAQLFARLDRDGDGELSAEEYAALRARPHREHGHRQGGPMPGGGGGRRPGGGGFPYY